MKSNIFTKKERTINELICIVKLLLGFIIVMEGFFVLIHQIDRGLYVMSPKILRPFVDQYPWLYVAGLIFLMVLILSIPYYTKELRERIHVGTKILFMIERNVKEIHDTGITTTYYINGFSQGTYKNYRTDWRTDRESVLTTVTSLKKRGLTIEYASGTQVFIKYKEICGGFGVALKGLEGIAKEMNIIE